MENIARNSDLMQEFESQTNSFDLLVKTFDLLVEKQGRYRFEYSEAGISWLFAIKPK